MAADIQIRRWTGASGTPTKTDITGLNSRHRTDDVVAQSGAANALPVPAIGFTTYSFWQSLRLYVSGGTFTAVNNVIAWTSGSSSHPAGVTTVAEAATDYTQAGGTVGVSGDELNQTNYPDLVNPPVDIFTFDSANPLQLNGSVASPGPADLGDFIVTQVQVEPGVATGAITAETLWFSWDET
jgi:hypothetical protein